MSVLRIETAQVYEPLLSPARYKGAYGGRGSGKSHFFGGLAVERCLYQRGTSIVCIREIQRTLAQSSKRLIEAKIRELAPNEGFRVFNDKIETPGGGIIIFTGMQNHNADSIKSLEDFDVAWVEEAHRLSGLSLALLRPTIRKKDSELWFSWNATRKTDAVDDLLRGNAVPKDAVVVKANWRDNPWFPRELEEERQHDAEHNPEGYPHIWEGEYATAFVGAYYAKHLAEAKREGRIGKVVADPLLPIRAYFDIGGSGATADAMSIWICQFAGREIRVLDHITGQGQVLAYYVKEMRSRGYDDDTLIRLPHDGIVANNITGKRYEDHLREAGFRDVLTIPNQGRGAAMLRVEAVRRLFPRIWFNEEKTEAGRAALGFYHEKRDDVRGIGLGPEHDWSSHDADAFGLMCIDYEEPPVKKKKSPFAARGGGWMGA